MREKTTIPATLEEVSKFTQSLERQLEQLPIEERTLIILAIQELLVNIVEHAYAGEPGEIEFELSLNDNDLIVIVFDNADHTFDMPNNIVAPDPLDLPENGMGLYIIQQSFDNVKHSRMSNGNQWQLEKKLR